MREEGRKEEREGEKERRKYQVFFREVING